VAVAHHFAAGGFGPVDVNAYKAAIRATGYHFFEPHSIAVNEAGLNGGIGTEQQVLDELLPPLLRVEAGAAPPPGTPTPPRGGSPTPLPGSTATPQLYREVGIGVAHLTATGVTVQPTDNRPRVTGSVFLDANGNGRYDLGEGLSGVTVRVAGGRPVAAFAS